MTVTNYFAFIHQLLFGKAELQVEIFKFLKEFSSFKNLVLEELGCGKKKLLKESVC